jgi:hypothetical protein
MTKWLLRLAYFVIAVATIAAMFVIIATLAQLVSK